MKFDNCFLQTIACWCWTSLKMMKYSSYTITINYRILFLKYANCPTCDIRIALCTQDYIKTCSGNCGLAPTFSTLFIGFDWLVATWSFRRLLKYTRRQVFGSRLKNTDFAAFFFATFVLLSLCSLVDKTPMSCSKVLLSPFELRAILYATTPTNSDSTMDSTINRYWALGLCSGLRYWLLVIQAGWTLTDNR